MLFVPEQKSNFVILRHRHVATSSKIFPSIAISVPTSTLRADCREGTCYEGACRGAGEYAIDGKCETQHKNRKCSGKWESCCNNDGVCGSTADFCGIRQCQSGNCTKAYVLTPTIEQPWLFSNSTYGTCSSTEDYVCNSVYVYCCGRDSLCGNNCGAGW